MEYIIKEIIDGKEEIIYTKYYDEVEREYFDLYIEEEGIDQEKFENEIGDIDELWFAFYESEIYKEFLEFIEESSCEMKTIEIINTQQVWVEWRDTIKITEAEYAQLKNGELTAQHLFIRCENMKQTDMWFADGENEINYAEVA